MEETLKKINDTVLKILDIIKFSQDKAAFVEDFDTTNRIDALSNLADKLPDDIKNSANLTPEQIEEAKKYVVGDEYLQEIEKVAKEKLHKFVEQLSPDFTDEQKQQVDALLKALDESSATAWNANEPAPAAYPQPESASEATAAPAQPQTDQPAAQATPQENQTA